jgi:hypothetical protein
MINLTVFDEYACFSLHLFWFDGDDLVQYCLIPEHPITCINLYSYFSNLSHSNPYDACFRFYFFTSIIYSVAWIMNVILSISIFLSRNCRGIAILCLLNTEVQRWLIVPVSLHRYLIFTTVGLLKRCLTPVFCHGIGEVQI